MTDLFATGRIVDLILGLMVLEGLGLFLYRQKTGSGIATRTLVTNLLAGGCLLLAVRLALAGAQWPWVSLWLAAALLAHLADLRTRWQP